MIRSEISAYRLGKNSFRIVIKKDMKNELFSVFVLSAVALTAADCDVMAQRTTRRNLHAQAAADVRADVRDVSSLRSVAAPDASVVTVRGYDKPLRSRRETFFVTNNMKSDTLRRVYLTFTYVDGSGRMLHSQSREVECELPPAETRQMNVPSWDVQQNFYFVRSSVSNRAAQATPFDVKITVDSISGSTGSKR